MIGARVVASDEARSRHPSIRSPLPADTLRHRVADSLDLEGAPFPEIGAAILETRGSSGMSVVAFARRAGVDAAVLRRAEAGRLPRDQLPGPLRRMVPR